MIPIFMASDEKFVKYMSVTIQSIISNTQEEIEFYVLDGGITQISKNALCEMLNVTKHKIEFIQMDMKEFEKFPDIRHFSKNTYFRYLIPNLKPQFDKVLYVDTDMLIFGNINELYSIDLDDNGIGAVVYMDETYGKTVCDPIKKNLSIPLNHQYFNAGLLLIDCNYWRKNDIVNLLFKKTEELKDILEMPDQDVLNILFTNKYKSLPAKYNLVVDVAMDYIDLKTMVSKLSGCYILHYTGGRGIRPWIKKDILGAEYFWVYAKMTPFYEDLCFDLISNQNVQIQEILSEIKSNQNKKDKFIEKLFSIKNSENKNHKVITILGLKIKIRRKSNGK